MLLRQVPITSGLTLDKSLPLITSSLTDSLRAITLNTVALSVALFRHSLFSLIFLRCFSLLIARTSSILLTCSCLIQRVNSVHSLGFSPSTLHKCDTNITDSKSLCGKHFIMSNRISTGKSLNCFLVSIFSETNRSLTFS